MQIKIYTCNKNYYNAQGFVEALIAILITGVAAMVFMTIAAKTISNVVKNELFDELTQEGVTGASILEYVVERWNNNERNILTSDFLNSDDAFQSGIGQCFALDGDVVTPYVSSHMVCQYNSVDGINPNNCLNDWNEVVIGDGSSEEKLFRIACISNESDIDEGVMVVDIFTGFFACAEVDEFVKDVTSPTDSCSVYKYVSIYKLMD